MSQRERRSMSAALQPTRLPAEALELIREGRPKPRVEVPIVADTGTSAQPGSKQALEPEQSDVRGRSVEVATPAGQSKPKRSKVVPAAKASAKEVARPAGPVGLTSVTFRLPPELATSLVRASADRKVKRERPHSQQEIAADAIGEWLRERGYLS